MRKNELGSEKLSELEKIRRIIGMKKESLNRLMVELAELRERELELMPLKRALEQSSPKGTARDELTPVEPLFQVSRTYQPG